MPNDTPPIPELPEPPPLPGGGVVADSPDQPVRNRQARPQDQSIMDRLAGSGAKKRDDYAGIDLAKLQDTRARGEPFRFPAAENKPAAENDALIRRLDALEKKLEEQTALIAALPAVLDKMLRLS